MRLPVLSEDMTSRPIDGLIVAFAGHLHPFGVLLFSFLLGGLRAGSIVGLQIRSGVPRELGGAPFALATSSAQDLKASEIGLELGFANVFSGPLVRSSYHAKEQALFGHQAG